MSMSPHELHGDGPRLALVHGSWGDASSWQLVVDALADSFRVLVYDRRGHSPPGQGSVHEDAEDLGALLESLDLAPAHVAANSYRGNIALRLVAARPELFRSLSCHEPPLWDLLARPVARALVRDTGDREPPRGRTRDRPTRRGGPPHQAGDD
jgi:pimeloyl-ACP methyl ester carboxylesterase